MAPGPPTPDVGENLPAVLELAGIRLSGAYLNLAIQIGNDGVTLSFAAFEVFHGLTNEFPGGREAPGGDPFANECVEVVWQSDGERGGAAHGGDCATPGHR